MRQDNQDELISIIMPLYNAEKYLHECVNSILAQAYTNWELLAVDDFSDDNSQDILRAFAQKDRRITLLENREKGIIPALELAYSRAQGFLITRMDADDIMTSSKLLLLAQALQKSPNGCATAKVSYFSDTTLHEGYQKYADWLNGLIDKASHYENIYKECVVPSPCWMMQRETIERIGGITDTRYPEDYDMCFRLYQMEVPIVCVHSVLHHWRDHGLRASRNDPNYADQHFIPLKLHYFLATDYNEEKDLLLWGGGKSGKFWAKALQEKNISFRWITGNPNKIGHNIYGVVLQSDSQLDCIENVQIIIAIKDQGFTLKKGALIQSLQRSNTIFNMY